MKKISILSPKKFPKKIFHLTFLEMSQKVWEQIDTNST